MNVPTIGRFLRSKARPSMVREGKRADLIIGNNVLAQVPDLDDFVGGMATLLAPNGVITSSFRISNN